MRRLLLLFLFVLAQMAAFGQGQAALLVTAEFTGSGTYDCAYGQDGSYVRLAVKNNTTTTRSFCVYSCSWWESWKYNKFILRLPNAMLSCDKNFPKQIDLASGQEIVFYSFLILKKAGNEEDFIDTTGLFNDDKYEIRFGFVETQCSEYFKSESDSSLRATDKIYWSNPVQLKFPHNSFVVQPQPAK